MTPRRGYYPELEYVELELGQRVAQWISWENRGGAK